jgi:uncharacterized protein (TIGR03435 family)
MKRNPENLDQALARYSNPPTDQVESAVGRVWKNIVPQLREGVPSGLVEGPAKKSRRSVLVIAAVLLVVSVAIAVVRSLSPVETAEQSTPILSNGRTASSETARSQVPVAVAESSPRPAPQVRGAGNGARQFDVASVKVEDRPPGGARVADVQGLSCTGKDGVWRATTSSGLTPFSAPRGRCVGRYVGIQVILAALNDVPLGRVTGTVPNWRGRGSPYEFGFSIEAVAEDTAGVTTAELKGMLQSLVNNRFKLKVHIDKKEMDGYALVLASDGLKLQPVSAADETFPTLEESYRQQVIKGKTSIKRFVEFLPQVGSRCTLADKTGLNGIYNYTLTLRVVPQPGTALPLTDSSVVPAKKGEGRAAVDNSPAGPESCAPLRGRNAPGASVFYEYTPSFAASVQEQLGLRLEAQKLLVDYVVIDEVREPAEN